MKRKHILLFLTACLLLYASDMFAAGLIALALVFQMNLLFFEIPLTKSSQLAAFKLFFFSVPIFFFLGAVHSFLYIYSRDAAWLFLFFAICITYCLFFLVHFLTFFTFKFFVQSQYKISVALQAALMEIRHKKRDLLVQACGIFILSLVPVINTEWKIIFAVTVFQLYLFRYQLKRVFGFSR